MPDDTPAPNKRPTDERPIYEKLGAFYLGKDYDLDAGQRTDELVLYDSKDLVTHAVIVGMTGSGKTGLGIGLLEEAAIDGIPALIIDPKGDLSNLLLNFPELRPEDFLPWIHSDDAKRQGQTAEQYAEQTANRWREGLAEWDQEPSRIARLAESAEFRVYTPGSDAGLPISILSSFAAPSPEIRNDRDLFTDSISTTATSLLGLLSIDTDPLRSREHILVTSILETVWNKGQDLDLGSLIQLVQSPPIDKIGVMDLESFYPSDQRFELAMALNNLLAAPSFSSWLEGTPLNVDRLLYSETGRPQMSIFSISHLSDSERMFFVSLLLNETLGWMRTRSGTNSLRALLYIDEIFGYMPPVAEPPSKKPLLTLLKQARAFGLGVVLSTQNPVDLDYKGLSNTGTWFLGRLQTERDKDRVLDGLEGATQESGEEFDRAQISEILSNVDKRVFLMHNVHEDGPAVFQTRWALSYLAGPLTRNQIRQLTDEPATEEQPPSPQPKVAKTQVSPDVSTTAPLLDPDIPQVYLSHPDEEQELLYVPRIMAQVKIDFVDSRRDLSADESLHLLLDVDEDAADLDWSQAREVQMRDEDLSREAPSSGRFAPLPSLLSKADEYKKHSKALADHLYRTRRYELKKSTLLGEYAKPGESERDFRIRLTEEAREERDERVDALRKKYASRLRTAEDRVQRGEQAVDRETAQADEAQMQSMISLGSNILGAVFGRKRISATRVSSTARGWGRASKQKQDIQRAQARLESYRERLDELEAELQEEIEEIGERFAPLSMELDTIELKPRKRDIDVQLLAIAWIPEPIPRV